ncbi:hypothetical protein [Persicobacter psychrovividus]|uniref:Uncharacterized protein n=1 Tax=Persicobacter psychrovividus TaxID=387638 RepID=A0ABM7VLG9_9BACT|nr:hypothetical protein PEPS_41310 [Persicobacter psychrovividus]
MSEQNLQQKVLPHFYALAASNDIVFSETESAIINVICLSIEKFTSYELVIDIQAIQIHSKQLLTSALLEKSCDKLMDNYYLPPLKLLKGFRMPIIHSYSILDTEIHFNINPLMRAYFYGTMTYLKNKEAP